MNRTARLFSTALMALAAAGCSGGTEDPGSAKFSTVDVQGKVTMKGQPVNGGILVLIPKVDGGSSQQASGEIKADGSYTVNSGGGKTGAMPGQYTVRLEKADGSAVNTGETPLTVEVPAAGGELAIAIP